MYGCIKVNQKTGEDDSGVNANFCSSNSSTDAACGNIGFWWYVSQNYKFLWRHKGGWSGVAGGIFWGFIDFFSNICDISFSAM